MSEIGLPSTLAKTISPFHKALPNTLLFLAQRLGFGFLVFVGIIFLSYFGLNMARDAEFGVALRHAIPKTVTYLGHLLQGDLGMSHAITSTALPHAIGEMLPDILGKSFGLLGISLLFAAVIGITLGTIAATRRQRSLTILLVSLIGISAPSFFVALLLQMLVIRWTQAAGRTMLPVGGFGWDDHLILPVLVLAARPIAQITRITYITISEVLSQDFVRTAHSKGLHPSLVLWRHVFRNTAVPILTTIGLSLRFSLSSLPVVEFFFGWPGIGFLLLKAISQRDDNLTIALLLSLGLFFILVNLLLEVGYRFIDPRLREIPEYIASGERQTVAEAWRALKNWRPGRLALGEWGLWLQSSLQSLLPSRRRKAKETEAVSYGRSWRRGTVGNIPLMVGSLLVGTLVIIFIWGPELAPYSPYTTIGLRIIDGEFIAPPFAPGAVYPWGTDVLGRDMLSLILAGAQQTLILTALVVITRLLWGIVLGAMAGWWNGTWVDRIILAGAEILAAFPTLLLAMILILAFGIREGLRPFLIALSVVGWSEIMQFVRSEVIAIRPEPFIESAVAAGSRTTRIITHHVLPNLISALISLAALEMGAVLMLLGELGFLSIFIGGGAFAELEVDALRYHYSDVPEWASLLSNVRPYARSYYWTALYPSLAFFFAILGFNLFGEGIRRLVQVVGVQITRLFNRYTLALALLAIFTIGWVRENTGAITFYRQQAAQFDGQRTLAHVAALTDPAWHGRSLDTPGLEQTAAYIAAQFEEMGLQAAGEDFTYFQPRLRDYEVLLTIPEFSINDNGPPLVYRQDYAEFPGRFANMGQAAGPVHVFARGALTTFRAGFGGVRIPILEELDFSQEIVMILDPADAQLLNQIPHLATLVVSEDDAVLSRRYTLSARELTVRSGSSQTIAQIPEYWITEATADRLLQGTGQTVATIRRDMDDLEQDEIIAFSTDVTASIEITGTVKKREEVVHVVGHLPGLSERGLNSETILVITQYDSPPPSPDGVFYPGANDNASGVAVMLEVIRTIRESGYQPYKTFLFVAYSAEGQEGGNAVFPPDVSKFLEAKYGFSRALTIEAVVDIRGLGAADSDQFAIAASGSLRLAELMERAADQMNVSTTRVGDGVDLSVVFQEGGPRGSGQEAPQVGWQGVSWQERARTAVDTLDTISAEKLTEAGRVLSLALMIMGRETQY